MAEDVQFGSFTNRHNFNFGDTQVSQIDFGNTRVWVNEVSVSITFDNQVAGTTIAGTFNISPGVPGASFSENFTWTTDDQTLDRFTASNCSLSDDGGGLITCTVTGATSGTNRRTRNIRISGTYPDNDLTSTATFTGAIITLTGSPTSVPHRDRNISRSSGTIRPDVAASVTMSISLDGYEPLDPAQITEIEPNPGTITLTSASGSRSTSAPAGQLVRMAFAEGFFTIESASLTISVGETATTVGASQTFTA